MKYIVEFEDEPCMYEDDVHFYKCIQAPWWGLSEKVIKQLTPYQPEPDCVSRKTALDAFGLSEKTRKYGGDHSGYDTRMLYEIQDTLENLPAVQPDHTADIGKKVSISCGQENDLISRQAAIDALARMMPRSYTPDGSHPADEEIFRVQEVFADCIEALEILPSAQPEPKWIPCSERLPERADNVIICYKAGDYTLVSTGRYLYEFKMWYVDVVGDLRDGVAAWKPLPEPYRGGEK